MPWTVLYDDDFWDWLNGLTDFIADEIRANIRELQEFGPNLGRPRVDIVKGAEHNNMKELRVQIAGEPWRVLFAFDPHRSAVLLVGGKKTGDKRWYKTHVPIADARFRRHLESLKK